MRVLVIQTAFIGDIVLTTPFLIALRDKWADCEIHVVTTPQGCEMLAGLENLTCHSLDKRGTGVLKGMKKVLTEIGRKTEFEFVFVVHRSMRSMALAKKVRAKRRIAFSTFWSRLFKFETVSFPAYDEKTHYADKPISLLKVLGECPKTPLPTLATDANSQKTAVAKLEKIIRDQRGYIVMSPFSVWGTKMWFADRFAQAGLEISKRLRVPVVIVGSRNSAETVTAKTIEEKIKAGGGKCLSLVGQTTLGELKELIRGAKLVVANDSAPIHIAAAFQVPTVGIFGPTVKKWGFFPLSTKSVVVERNDVACRPCHIHGPTKCPKGHFRCMNEIQVEDVVQAVQNLLR